MHRVHVSLYAAALTLLMSGLWWGLDTLAAKERQGSPGIPPEKVAAYIYDVIKADRTLYTTEIVNRLQAKGVTTASEHWEQENALMLPAQFLQHAGKLAAENGSGIRYRLIGLWPYTGATLRRAISSGMHWSHSGRIRRCRSPES
jgi:hypothetical protein